MKPNLNDLAKSRKARRKMRRLQGFSLGQIIPHCITLASASIALTGVQFALSERFYLAVLAILVAGILDGLDGRMARFLNVESDFGSQLDSLADFVASGVSPGLILYFWALNHLGGIGWALALIYIMCCGLRLARFNISAGKMPSYAWNYFQGVPAPAGAALVMFPIVVGFILNDIEGVNIDYKNGGLHVYMIGLWTLIVSGLMISTLPTFSFKSMKMTASQRPIVLFVFVLLMASLVGKPWHTIAFVTVIYMVSFIFSALRFHRLRQAAESLQKQDENTPPATD